MKINLPSAHLKLAVGGCCFLLLLSITGALGGGGPPLQGEIPIGFYSADDELPEKSSQWVYQEEETDRLPLSVQPIHYDLEIRPILDSTEADQFTAPGKVAILVKCFEATDSITLHSKDINIEHDAVTVTAVNPAGDVGVTGHSVDEPRGFYIIELDRNLTVDREYLVTIPFTAPIPAPEDRMNGLYQSSYVDENGDTKYLATTQFQKADASRAFPCFDEPSAAFRATFNVTIGRKQDGFHSLANTERIGNPVPIPGLPDWVWDIHAKTVNMPPYLIAIIVSDFVSETAPADLYPKPVRTWAQPTLMTDESGKFSAQAAARILTFFEEYFDYPYQLNKMDSVAIPHFAAGAMENWGLNTYRINLMVWLKEENTFFERWRSAAVIAHELVHQWFGNLVTCEWWNDTWLNEGFARYFQFIAANHTGMDFRSLDRYVIDTTQLAMDFDVLSTTEPVHSNVTDRVVNQGSRIVYEKAAALIRMMQSFLTEATLIGGLRTYLKRHEYGGVVQDDLFFALTEQARADRTFTQYTVKEVMDTWTLQSGFPVLRVSKISKTRLFISQEKFKLNPLEQDEAQWYVPISFVTASNPDFSPGNTGPKDWLDKDTILKSLTVDDADQWIIINPDARGFYRVIYDDALTQLILAQLARDPTVISMGSRSQLIDDHFKSANAKYISIRTAMDMTRYLSLNNELDFIVWTTVFNNLLPLSTRLADTPAFDNFKEYILSIIMGPLQIIGGNQGALDPTELVVLRTQLLDWACSMGHAFCAQTANRHIATWQAADPADPVPVATDIQPMVYCGAVAASTANNDIQDFLLEQYVINRGTRQQTLIVNALACDQVPQNLQDLMDKAIDEDPANELVIADHGLPLLERIAMSSVGRPLMMDFITAERDEINRIHGETAVATLISRMAPYLSSESEDAFRQEVDAFITAYLTEANLPPNVRTSLVASQRRIVENSEWMTDFYRDLSDWLTPTP